MLIVLDRERWSIHDTTYDISFSLVLCDLSHSIFVVDTLRLMSSKTCVFDIIFRSVIEISEYPCTNAKMRHFVKPTCQIKIDTSFTLVIRPNSIRSY